MYFFTADSLDFISFFFYKVSAGFDLSAIIHTGGYQWHWNLSRSFQLSVFTGNRWGIGLNAAALILFLLTLKVEGSTHQK